MKVLYNTASLRRIKQQIAHETLVLPGYPERQTIALSDVIYIEGAGNYATFHMINQTKIVVAYSLSSYEFLPGFLRIHKSYFINIEHIASLKAKSRNDAWVSLSNGIQLPISRRRVKQVASEFNGE